MEMERSSEIAFQEITDELRNAESDPLPEFCDYRDEGCEMAGSCLNCPFARCIHDEPRGKQRRLMRIRAGEMARLSAGGKKVKELATMFGVSPRTVQRALRGNNQAPSNK
ncbi:MAG: helix-turn-helix domain-containing protein [Chloroflexi bacterium]|nr:helix-turn-helix domain-containing protein [Chloroflexota bacterium]